MRHFHNQMSQIHVNFSAQHFPQIGMLINSGSHFILGDFNYVAWFKK